MPEIDVAVEWAFTGELRVPTVGEWYLTVGYSGGGLVPQLNIAKVPYEQVAPILTVMKTVKKTVEGR